jgi:beta-lactamase superfamily II metal-dependent hydrolase
MLTFTLFDVGHGFCAYATAPTGASILFDCGYDDQLQFYPSRYFADRNITAINRLMLSHFNQDHVCDLPNLNRGVTFGSILRNGTIPVEFIEREKRQSGVITSAMASAIDMHQNWNCPVTEPDWGGVTISTFCNPYPTFTDMTNLSMVTFLEYAGCGIVVPGDLERAGWEKLLENPSFCACLRRTDIFIASHHGRNAGYCEAVFDYCAPQIVILSDKNIAHASQEHDYTKHALGVSWNNSATEKRYVLTTRSDGHIRITKGTTGGFYATCNATL